MIVLKTLQAFRQELKQLFLEHRIESPETDAGLLLMHVLEIPKTKLLTQDVALTEEQEAKVTELASRRIQGEPIHYLLGSCPFMDLEFFVNPATLIPRPETELLVEKVLESLRKYPEPATLWDIGCGSGCIGLSLAYYHKSLQVVEVDISEQALKTAAKTAEKYNLQSRIQFLHHDILKGMPLELPNPQIIVSNPPYIPTKDVEQLMTDVKDYEPRTALDGGEDGLDFYRRIIKDAPLPKGGLLAFEIGYDQGESVPRLMEEAGYHHVELMQDLSGLDRIVTGVR